MAELGPYDAGETALLQVDPYNDFISEGGKLWERARETIEGVELLKHTRELIAAADQAGIRRFILPHHRWRPGDYAGWEHISASQRGSGAVKLFAAGEWGGEFRDEFAPREQDLLVQEHWSASGFANTDLDMLLKQFAIRRVVIIGMRANTCIDTTARFAQELGYHVTLVRDAIGAFSWEEMQATFELNAPTYAHAIVTTAKLLGAIGDGTAATAAPESSSTA
jgi:nicotinamidase-related amidase